MKSRTPSHSFSRFLSSRDPFARVFHSPDDGANNPGGDNSNQSGQQGQQSAQGQQSQQGQQAQNQGSDKIDFKALAQAVVAETLAAQSVNGDQTKAMHVLAGRNARLEAALTERTQELGAIKSKLPDDKQLQADQAELTKWRALSEKGIAKPEDVLTVITERDDFKGREEGRSKVESRDKAAKTAGYDPSKFAALRGVDDWQYEVEVKEQDGKKIESPFVVTKDDAGKETRKPLTEVVGEQFPALADSIKLVEQPAAGTTAPRTVQQGSGGTSGAGSIYEQTRKNAEERQKQKAPQGPALEERLNMKVG